MKRNALSISIAAVLLSQTFALADDTDFARTQFANFGDKNVECINTFFTRAYHKPFAQWATETLGADRLAGWKREFNERRAAKPDALFADFQTSFRATIKNDDLPALDWSSIQRAMGQTRLDAHDAADLTKKRAMLKAVNDRLAELRDLAENDEDTFYVHDIEAVEDFLMVQKFRETFATSEPEPIAKTCLWRP